jgi:hypothetical protein
MFDPAEVIAVDAFNTPTQLRTAIGHLVACPDSPAYQAAVIPASFCDGKPDGSLVIYNPTDNTVIPPDGTVVAVSAVVGGVLQELVTPGSTATADVDALEIPINEEDFFRPVNATSIGSTAVPLRPYIGRPMAEVLGKALFWDMQVGSDGVQACGTCHFHAGVDNRTRNQLNPNHLGGDTTLQIAGRNLPVEPNDFPFHKLVDPSQPGEPLLNPGNVASDANDVMSSMGVVNRDFVDIERPGRQSFIPGTNPGVLKRDRGIRSADPLGAVFQNVRRVEPRNTPTFHGAAFNLDNFWDGRARFHFNGGSVFGPSDPQNHIFIDPGTAGPAGGGLVGATNGHFRSGLAAENPEMAAQPVRAKFSSLASQAVGPPLSDFEMSFRGRSWPKIGKKLLQPSMTPLANQLVATDDSVLGPFSNQEARYVLPWQGYRGRQTGALLTIKAMITVAFGRAFWQNIVAGTPQHLNGASAVCTSAVNGVLTPAGCDPFDGYVLTVAAGPAGAENTNQFTQMEANFSMFFGMAVQAYEALTIPDDTPADRFFDANPNAGHGVGEPGDQAVLFPSLVPDLVDDGLLNNSAVTPTTGVLTMIPDDPATPEYDGFGPDELFGFDIFAGANLTAALPAGSARNPIHPITTEGGGSLDIAVGSNPFTRSAKCMLCHLGAEQTDHSINISHGLLKNGPEFEYPTPRSLPTPTRPACL